MPVQHISTECGVLFTSKALHIVGCSQRPWSASALGSSAGLLSRICSVSPPWRRPRRLAARIHLPEALTYLLTYLLVISLTWHTTIASTLPRHVLGPSRPSSGTPQKAVAPCTR